MQHTKAAFIWSNLILKYIMFVIFYLTYVNNNKKLNIYTTVEKFGIGKTFLNNFLSHLCSPMLHLFDQKYNKKS